MNPLGCVCERHNHLWEIDIYNQKPPYITMKPYLQQYCQRHSQEYISWNMNGHKPGKSRTSMMLLSLLRVQENNIVPKWYKTLLGFVLAVQKMVPCSYHLNPPAAISIYGWRYQARPYCTYANWLPCLFCLFILQLKLLHSCVSFWETNCKNALQQVLYKFWFIYYLYSSNSFGNYWFRNYVYLISYKKRNETKCFSKTDRLI